MKMIPVKCQGQSDKKCDKAYDGCKEQVMYSETSKKILCKEGQLQITE